MKEELLRAMLDTVPSEYPKEPGEFIYDALAPVAEQLVKMKQNIEFVKSQLHIENLVGEALEQRVKERTGIERKKATKAVGNVQVTGTGTIHQGDLFETEGGVQFQATETEVITNDGTVAVEAIQAGSRGNVVANTITLFPVTLAGFTAVGNPTPTQDGFEAESDGELLKRYYERVRTPATSANRAHYLNWAKEVAGVGDARIIPLWKGNHTVKAVIIDNDKKPASPALVVAVQQYIDPDKEGLGNGQAPLGAKTTVVSATRANVEVSVTVVLQSGYTLQQVKDTLTVNIEKYLRDIAFVESTVSFAKIGATILNSEGIRDYSQLRMNNGTANLSIGQEEVAVLGGVNVVT